MPTIDYGQGPVTVDSLKLNSQPGTGFALPAQGAAPAPAPAPAPGAPTIKDLYGNPDLYSAANAADAAKTASYFPEAIATLGSTARSDVLREFQSQLDSLDRAAAEARARITTNFAPIAKGRVGETTASEARRGLIGSDFGNAQTDTINTKNTTDLNNQINESDQKFTAQKDSLYQFIRQEGDKEASLRIDASQKGADAKIQEIQNRTTRAQASAQASAKAMISLGIVDPTNPNYSGGIASIATNTGLTKDQVKGIFDEVYQTYKKNKSEQDLATANLAKVKAETGAILTPEQVAAKEAREKAKNDADLVHLSAEDKLAIQKYNLDVTNSAQDRAYKAAEIKKIFNDISSTDASSVASWVTNVKNGTAKLSDVPKNLKDAVSVGLANSGASNQQNILNTTKQSLDELNAMVTNHQGFEGAVGAKGPSSLFGLRGQPVAGSNAADFDAKLKQTVNDVVLPNLSLLHGLGRVTDREFQALQSAVTSLSTNMSEDQFRAELKDITDRVNVKIAESAAADSSGGTDTYDVNGTTYKLGGDGKYYPSNSSSTNSSGSPNFNPVGKTSASTGTKGVVAGYDIRSYATDPHHENAIAQIYNTISHVAKNTVAEMDHYIHSVAPNSPVSGKDIIDAANTFGVDPKMVAALIQQDSSFGTRGLGAKTNNPGNVGNDDLGHVIKFANTRQGVFAVAKNLTKRKTG